MITGHSPILTTEMLRHAWSDIPQIPDIPEPPVHLIIALHVEHVIIIIKCVGSCNAMATEPNPSLFNTNYLVLLVLSVQCNNVFS